MAGAGSPFRILYSRRRAAADPGQCVDPRIGAEEDGGGSGLQADQSAGEISGGADASDARGIGGASGGMMARHSATRNAAPSAVMRPPLPPPSWPGLTRPSTS